MKRNLYIFAALLAVIPLLASGGAQAQQIVAPCVTGTGVPATSSSCSRVTATNPLPVSVSGGSQNATIVAPLGSQPAAASVSVAVASDQNQSSDSSRNKLIGKVGIDQTTPGTTNAVQTIPGASGGLSFATITAANSTNATNLKGTPGQLYHITGYSAAAVPTWVSFYNNSGTPTCGTNIVYQMLIPVNSTSGGGAVDDIPSGLAFSTGIGYCITTGIAGTGSVAASSIVVNFGYK